MEIPAQVAELEFQAFLGSTKGIERFFDPCCGLIEAWGWAESAGKV